jgi:hypothetical protein
MDRISFENLKKIENYAGKREGKKLLDCAVNYQYKTHLKPFSKESENKENKIEKIHDPNKQLQNNNWDFSLNRAKKAENQFTKYLEERNDQRDFSRKKKINNDNIQITILENNNLNEKNKNFKKMYKAEEVASLKRKFLEEKEIIKKEKKKKIYEDVSKKIIQKIEDEKEYAKKNPHYFDVTTKNKFFEKKEIFVKNKKNENLEKKENFKKVINSINQTNDNNINQFSYGRFSWYRDSHFQTAKTSSYINEFYLKKNNQIKTIKEIKYDHFKNHLLSKRKNKEFVTLKIK